MKKIKVVIGTNFGDEGKGVVVDYLVKNSDNPLVVRFSGGQQAGHTVTIGKKSHVFSNFGSGTLRGAPTYLSKFVTIDPVGIVNELNILKKLGLEPILYIDADAPITTPYDKLHNQNYQRDLINGTCGLGVGSTINREENFYSFTFSDLYFHDVVDIKLNSIKHFYNTKIVVFTDEFVDSVFQLINNPNIKLTHGIPDGYNLIFEGSQGLLLDQHYGFFPNVARTNTGTTNINELVGDNFDIYLVSRSYQTRHGNGPMTNENIYHDIKINPNETNVNNEYQGKFRRSILDVSLMEYAINKDKIIRNSKNINLVITCMDHLDEFVFTYKNKLIVCEDKYDFIRKISDLLKIKNIYTNNTPESNLELVYLDK